MMNSRTLADHGGWILLSDAVDHHLPPTSTVHHVDGCGISNGRNRLVEAGPKEVEGKIHCQRCEARLGLREAVGRPSEGVKVEVRLQPDDLACVDELAGKRGQTRAATLRELISKALRDQPPS